MPPNYSQVFDAHASTYPPVHLSLLNSLPRQIGTVSINTIVVCSQGSSDGFVPQQEARQKADAEGKRRRLLTTIRRKDETRN